MNFNLINYLQPCISFLEQKGNFNLILNIQWTFFLSRLDKLRAVEWLTFRLLNSLNCSANISTFFIQTLSKIQGHVRLVFLSVLPFAHMSLKQTRSLTNNLFVQNESVLQRFFKICVYRNLLCDLVFAIRESLRDITRGHRWTVPYQTRTSLLQRLLFSSKFDFGLLTFAGFRENLYFSGIQRSQPSLDFICFLRWFLKSFVTLSRFVSFRLSAR